MTDAPGPGAPVSAAEAAERRSALRWSRIIGFIVGVALLAAAVMAMRSAGGSVRESFAPLRDADPWLGATLIGAIAASTLLTAALFWVLTTRYGRVGFLEMWALINAAWLLNYLPVRPGLFGRMAYHRAVNGVRVVDSAKALVWANVLMLLGAAICAVVATIAGAALTGDHWLVIVISLAPIPSLGAFAAYARFKRPEPDPEVWRLIAGAAIGYAVQLSWAVRFLLCFWLLGQPLAWGGAVALAAVAALAGFVPVTGNGLGIREWVVGLVAPALPVSLVAAGNLTRGVSLASDLTNRAAELIVAVPLGLICGWWALRRMARARQARTPEAAPIATD